MLIARVRSEPDSEIVQLWAIEAQRRLDEFEQGLTDGMPEEEVFRQVRESLR
ncbi:MAG: addiction module protein [Candidatus Hydrogenedentes bacterium]|nr:addiction module protein [Candidatus Hydrogenedentota bacterium]